MASEHVPTMNLFDDGEGMVPLQTQDKPSTAFKPPEKNMSTNKDTMDSTPTVSYTHLTLPTNREV